MTKEPKPEGCFFGLVAGSALLALPVAVLTTCSVRGTADLEYNLDSIRIGMAMSVPTASLFAVGLWFISRRGRRPPPN